jgi:hypothetical protein
VRRFSRRTGLLATGVVALLVAARLSPRAIPYNMDEFVHYQALGCLTAVHARDLPVIRDGCGYFDLRLPFSRTPLPLRSYSYIGSIPSLPFYPFWRLFDAPVASRVGGAAYFLLFALLARRLLRVRVGSIVTASLVFPVWLVTFLVDEGPVGFSAVLLLLALLAARRALHAPGAGARAAWAAAAGLGLFLGLWTKLVFAWWLPAFAVFAVEEARRPGLSLTMLARRRASALLAGARGLLLPTAVLLASTDRDGRSYAAVLRHGDLSAEAERVEAVAVRLVRYVTDGSLVAPRNLTLPSWPVDILPLLLSVALLAAGWRWSRRRREVVTWVILSALTFAFAASSGYSQWPHHFAFPLLLLVFALALCLDGLPARGRLAAAALAVVFWATLGARLPSTAFSVEASPDKDVLLAFVRGRGLDRQTLQVHASWGTYYLALLFGDQERMVVYVRRIVDDPAQLRKMAELARRVGRPLLLVSSRRWERIETPQVREVLGPPLHTWRFGDWWAIEHDPRVGEGVKSSSPLP